MNVQDFSHVTINVKDLARSLRFYVGWSLFIVDGRMRT
jgi:catechol 2,3-dioxygenase-like lactoylglutathione lyase family enzyme